MLQFGGSCWTLDPANCVRGVRKCCGLGSHAQPPNLANRAKGVENVVVCGLMLNPMTSQIVREVLRIVAVCGPMLNS